MTRSARVFVVIVVLLAALCTGARAQFPNPPLSAPAAVGELVLFVLVVGPVVVERPAIVVRGFGPGTTTAELHVFKSITDGAGWPTFAAVDVPHHDARFEPGENPPYSWHRLEPKFVLP